MARALVGDAQARANGVQAGNADRAVQFGRQDTFEGVGRGVGMGLAIGDDPVLDRWRHQPCVAMALLLKDGVPGGAKAGLPAKGGGPRDGGLGPLAGDIPGYARRHGVDHQPLGRLRIHSIRHRADPPIQTLLARPGQYTRSGRRSHFTEIFPSRMA